MLQGLGYESSALTVAHLFSDVMSGIVIDVEDVNQREAIQALPLRVAVTNTVMRNESERERLARETLAFAEKLATSDGREDTES